MDRFDFRIEAYKADSGAKNQEWAARPHVWEMTADKAKPILLDEERGGSKEEATDKATRSAKKYIAQRTIEDD